MFGGSEFAPGLLSLLPSPCDHLFIFVFFGCASQALWSFVLISLCYPCIYTVFLLSDLCHLILFDSFHRTQSFAFQETETKSKETQGESLESLVVERDELLAVASLGDLKSIFYIDKLSRFV